MGMKSAQSARVTSEGGEAENPRITLRASIDAKGMRLQLVFIAEGKHGLLKTIRFQENLELLGNHLAARAKRNRGGKFQESFLMKREGQRKKLPICVPPTSFLISTKSGYRRGRSQIEAGPDSDDCHWSNS
jgi:hypothetical protein